MWVKRGTIGTQTDLFSFVSTTGSAQQAGIQFDSNNAIRWWQYVSPSYAFQKITTAVFRDPSAWYHLVFVYDTTLATATDRCQIWVNGVRQTSFSTSTDPTQNLVTYYKTGTLYPYLGAENRNASSALSTFDGYITEVNFIDGQALTPSSFGETDAVTGVWKPKKYTGTYGTNGFYLNFSDNSAATAAAIGKDYSGNGNNWTPNNISVTAGVTYDSMLDVPTQWADGGNGRGNYCTGNPLITYTSGGAAALKNGNLDFERGGAGWAMAGSTIAVSTGKWYWEATFIKTGSGDGNLGIHKTNTSLFQIVGYSGDPNGYGYGANGSKFNNTTGAAYGASYTSGDVIGVALDLDAGTLTFYKNNASQGVAFSSLSGEFFPAFSSDNGTGTGLFQANFGQRPFNYTPPTGFKALNTLNLNAPNILKGNQYFDATLYTGTNATLSITNSGSMQPDLLWFKRRNAAASHALVDAVRGVSKVIQSDLTGAEQTSTAGTGVSSFDSGGFTLGSDTSTSGQTNPASGTMVAWQWKEGATQGFDIVTYTGDGTSPRNISHSLGVVPSMVIVKNRSAIASWMVKHKNLSSNNNVFLESTGAQTTPGNGYIQDLNNSSTFGVINGGGGVANINANGNNYVAYLFSEVAGFSKFGSYTGNASADGPFVFCGFRPKFVLFKRTDSATGGDWAIYDTSRDTYNAATTELYPDNNLADTTAGGASMDILSNGFKIRNSRTGINASGGTYIFAAFAENPFKNALAR